MKYPEFANEIDAAFKPILAPIGFFRTRYGKWGRNRGEDLHGIDIQKRSSKELVCVNLGIHYTFLPLTCFKSKGNRVQVDVSACKLHFRLNPRGTDGDHWWPIEEGSVEEIAKALQQWALPLFETYRSDGVISTLEGRDVVDGKPNILLRCGDVGACLILAAKHESLGNIEKCVDAARLGLERTPPAGVSARVKFKEYLKRHGATV